MSDIVSQLWSAALYGALGNREIAEMTLYSKAADEITRLRAENKTLGIIRCPDWRMHKWDGDGQCATCCNYATDLIDKALRGERNKDDTLSFVEEIMSK